MRVSFARSAVLLLGCVCFLTVTWIQSVREDSGPAVDLDLLTLQQRLHAAEQLGGQVSKDLNNILEQLKNPPQTANATQEGARTTTTTTTTTPQVTLQPSKRDIFESPNRPNVHLYLPHLREHTDSLVPRVTLGRGRSGVSMVLGIPTVKRAKQSYLVSTLESLLYELSPSQSQDLLIIVFVAETDHSYISSMAETISTRFPKEVESGLIEVVSPSEHYYPDFSTLKETFGDSKDRVRWRTKQNLDYSFLMLYAQPKGTYYVQLEDDVVAKTDYYESMKSYTVQKASEPWLFLEFSQLGFIGKMFRTRDLPLIVDFFLMFHKDKPIDWLLDHILWVKVCNPEKDNKHCDGQKALLKLRYKPSLFQHVGLHSSLPGKTQPLKDKDFGKQKLFTPHSNPAAQLITSLKHYQVHSLERAYQGNDFFWAFTPVKGDFILFNFSRPLHITSYLFRSGNIETSTDKLYNTTVEVLPSHMSAGKSTSGSSSSTDGFVVIGEFDQGLAEGRVDSSLQPVSALRLVVRGDSDFWVILREIFIQV